MASWFGGAQKPSTSGSSQKASSARGRRSPPRKKFKMVVIGETGSGKTSFLQLLLNYAKQFGLDDFDLEKISSFVTAEVVPSKKKESWDSDTTKSKKYSAEFGEFKLDIIDTPGFADTRGDDQEKENVANIIGVVKEELYVNCICLIINGTQVRLTAVLREVITQIVSILPPDVMRNIIVVFTKVRDEFSLKFDIKLLQRFQLSIPSKFVFTIDNPYSRYESVTKEMDKKIVKKFLRDFEETHETLDEMFNVIKKLKPAVTIKFGEFHEVVQDIEVSFAKLRIHHKNKIVIAKLIQDMGSVESQVRRITYDKMVAKDSEKKNLVCTVDSCYGNCHMNCDCWFTFFSVRACCRIQGGICTECSHSYSDHIISKIYYEKVSTEVFLPDLSRIARTRCLEKESDTFDIQISKETVVLESKIKKFQGLGSNFFFSKNAIEQIGHQKEEIGKIPGFKFKDRINAMLDATLEVLDNPLTAKHDEIKYRWACGVLGVDPSNVSEAEIAKQFRLQARQFHPDATGDESSSSVFKHINYAKDLLKRSFFKEK